MTERLNSIQKFLNSESAGGMLLMVSAAIALIIANSPLSGYYGLLLDTPIAVQIGTFEINKPLLLWVNDGLMAVFFFLVGLELKRELIEGELSQPSKIMLPAIGAVGGMVVPAFIYLAFNLKDPVAMQGWAIPAATDIAFALGILSLLGSRVPISLKIFLTSLAIFDDIGAIVIIALFYTSKLSLVSLITALVCLIPLYVLNKRGVTEKSPYILIGLIMWAALLKSGVHATLAGVALAIFIPIKEENGVSPLKSLEHDLHTAVAFFILPFFAFCNAGVPLLGLTFDQVVHPIPLGIAAGLFVGKQVGIYSLCWFAIKMKIAEMPKGMTNSSLYATAALCGVGFTMSLFIGSLAFEETGVNLLFDERLGILIGSLASGIVGFIILNVVLPRREKMD
ncbi:Na+/H+ antiporter NhaA [Temperatibacter marinus]|uniref:Na(+)/H(+) antiporter NhaA n=1 Tax=Temperatibacter marinus TaxID=1456591 RepID=A0AA52ED72_9PROT|nr:Na+/H+ antiporter NhaA [Temperatibacter marinus]WND02535.1 Na+/H+ antiporter NhaA [Temperatibacter marinus]